MNNKGLRALCLCVGMVLSVGLLYGHHSNSIYDESNYVSLIGTVAKFEFVNPHVLIHIDVKGSDGNIVTWTTLGGPPNRMNKGAGWNRKTFQTGEELNIIGFPFRDGRPGMLFQKILRSNGEVVPMADTVVNFSRRQDREFKVIKEYGTKSE
jgi:hypothetical protein